MGLKHGFLGMLDAQAMHRWTPSCDPITSVYTGHCATRVAQSPLDQMLPRLAVTSTPVCLRVPSFRLMI